MGCEGREGKGLERRGGGRGGEGEEGLERRADRGVGEEEEGLERWSGWGEEETRGASRRRSTFIRVSELTLGEPIKHGLPPRILVQQELVEVLIHLKGLWVEGLSIYQCHEAH